MITHDPGIATQCRRTSSAPHDGVSFVSDEDDGTVAAETERCVMTMLQGFKIALHALRLNPLRSFLTMLGIVIGVASIVTVFAIGAGAQLRLQEQIRSIGANVLMITPGAVYQGGVRLKEGSKLTMTESDVQAILEASPGDPVRGRFDRRNRAEPSMTARTGTRRSMVRRPATSVWCATGSSPRDATFPAREEAAAGKGRPSSEARSPRELFALGDDPIGARIRIMKVPLEVVGVLDHKGPAQDDVAFVPLTTAKLRFLGSASNINRDSVAYIIAKVGADGQMAGARSEIEGLLRQRHRIAVGQEDDFKGPGSGRRHGSAAGGDPHLWRFLLLVYIASVSLLSRRHQHHERHDRVGDRAHPRNSASAARSAGGCGTSVSSSSAKRSLLWPSRRRHRRSRRCHHVDDGRAHGRWITSIDSEAIALALAFSIATGLIFGFYPAHKASKPQSNRGTQDGMRTLRWLGGGHNIRPKGQGGASHEPVSERFDYTDAT